MDKIKNDISKGFVLSSKYSYIIEDLKKQEPLEYNPENFYIKANEDRYNSYLNDVVLKHVKDKDEILSHIEEKSFYGNQIISGVFEKDKEVTCIVPHRKTLLDEIVNIHEITHLISHLNSFSNSNSVSKEIIPFFNEYAYLSQIHDFYAKYYEQYRYNNAIEAAKRMKDINYKDCLSYILAYLVLEHRKENYDIDKLNKINAKTKSLEKSLNSKGYTF